MLLAALSAEVDEYVAQHIDHRDEAGHALVVRNGMTEPRTLTTAAGELEKQAPRVRDRRDGRRFTSAILPPWARRSPKVNEVLPVLYLRGSKYLFDTALVDAGVDPDRDIVWSPSPAADDVLATLQTGEFGAVQSANGQGALLEVVGHAFSAELAS